MKNMTHITRMVLVLTALGAFFLLSGCASKKYVRQQIDPLTGKVSEISDLTKKNSNDIQDVDSRAQRGIQDAAEKADNADQKAVAATDKAEAAQSTADNLSTQVTGLQSRLGNIDQYQEAQTVNLGFGFNHYTLDKKAMADLDSLAEKIQDQNGYVIQIEGYTDSVGNKEYNNELSQKRAQAVVRYLAEKHDIPLYRMFIIGLGETKPVDTNKTKVGRAENRRVEVHLLENPNIQSAQKQ